MTGVSFKLNIWQCAWCNSLIINGEKIYSADRPLEMSHGICSSCGDALLKKYSSSSINKKKK